MTTEEDKLQFELDEAFPIVDLHEDLLPFRYDDPTVGTVIKHPLVVSIFHNDRLNSQVNKAYMAKQQMIKDAIRDRKYHTYVFLHERPFRPTALHKVAWRMTDHEEYWQLVASVWQDTENLFQWYDLVDTLLAKPTRPDRFLIMTKEERDALDALPDTIKIFRGYNGLGSRFGWSWTLDIDVARWFAKRLLDPSVGSGAAKYCEGTVEKRKVIALFTGRGEKEIVVDPTDVEIGSRFSIGLS